MNRSSPADKMVARNFQFRSLRDGALIVALFSLAIAAVMGSALAGEPRSSLIRFETVLWVCAAALLVTIGFRRSQIDDWLRAHRAGGFIVTALICAFASWSALSPNLDARLGVIDDHVIVAEIGPGSSHLKWNQWPERLRESEAFSFGAEGRYRPAYSALQLAECSLWGRDAQRWYLAHMALCATALLFLTRAGSKIIGFSLAFAGSMALFGTTAIADTYCRLGPSEAYAMPALALGIWALAKACRGDGAWCWWVTFAGFALGSMCKENMVPLAVLACVIGAIVLLQQKHTRLTQGWPALGLLAVHTIFMMFIIVRMLNSKGTDIYSGNIGVGSMITPFTAAGLMLLFCSTFTALWPLIGWSWWSVRRTGAGADSLVSKSVLGFILVALAAWFSQAAFYRDTSWPTGHRYDLPGIIVPVVLLIFGARHLLRITGGEPARQIVMSTLFMGLMLAGGNGAAHHVRMEAVSNAAVTKKFAGWVSRLAKAALADPKRTVVLYPERPLNHYEMVHSVGQYLRHKKVVNPVYYSTRFLGQPVGNTLEKSLFHLMKTGTTGQHPPLLTNEALAAADALSVTFSAESAAVLAGESANLHPGSLDDILRKPAR